jgi:hypothetical protein
VLAAKPDPFTTQVNVVPFVESFDSQGLVVINMGLRFTSDLSPDMINSSVLALSLTNREWKEIGFSWETVSILNSSIEIQLSFSGDLPSNVGTTFSV